MSLERREASNDGTNEVGSLDTVEPPSTVSHHQSTTSHAVANNALRADAPVFIPSSTSIVFEADNIGYAASIGNQTKKKRNGRRQGNSKNNLKQLRQTQQQEDQRRKNRPNLPRFGSKSTSESSENRSLRHHSRRKQNFRAASSKRQAERDKKNELNFSNPHNPSHTEMDPASPLEFPALFSSAPSETPVPTIWSRALRFELVNAGPQRIQHTTIDAECNPTKSFGYRGDWGAGLEMLTTNARSRKEHESFHSIVVRQEFAEWDDDEAEISLNSTPSDQVSFTDGNRTDAGQNQQSLTATKLDAKPAFNRPKMNMNRLRDRWWEALAQRRLRNEFEKELSNALVRYRVDPVVLEDNHKIPNNLHSEETATITMGLCEIDEAKSDVGEITELDTLNVPTSSPQGHPLEDIMDRNNDHALLRLLESHSIMETGIKSLASQADAGEQQLGGIVNTAVRKNKPDILKIALSHMDDSSTLATKMLTDALMHSIEFGYEDCVSVLLSTHCRLSNVLASKDENGNNILHYCCRGSGSVSLLKLLLKHIPGSSKAKQQHLSKLLLTRNYSHQSTPFHEACRFRHVAFVEIFLNACNTLLLSKVLSTEDIHHQTPLLVAISNNASDVVTALIMFRYNHNNFLPNPLISSGRDKRAYVKISRQKTKNASEGACPLVWAAKEGNLKMIDLLIQFGDQSGSVYRLTEALHSLLRSNSCTGTKIEGVELLTDVGANAFEEISLREIGSCSATVLATQVLSSPSILRSVVQCGKAALKNSQLSRKRDPTLRLQPESFFRALELRENAEMKTSLTSALLDALLRAFLTQESIHFSMVDVLYEADAKLDKNDLERLQAAMQTRNLPSEPLALSERCIMAVFNHFIAPEVANATKLKNLESDRSPLASSSYFLLEMPDMMRDKTCMCPWLAENVGLSRQKPCHRDDEVILVSEDGSRFKVHEFVVARKSEKLESSIRFNRMNRGNKNDRESMELVIPVSARLLNAMIQHFYHGSISLWPSLNKLELVRFLLELMLVAEEFLCQDLMKEIEMRLLSSEPQSCFCWSCCQAVRVHPSRSLSAQCLYFVDTGGSLLAESSIFDILGLTEYSVQPEYTLSLLDASVASAKTERSEVLWRGGSQTEALAALKDCLRLTVLSNFSSIRRFFGEDLDRFVRDTEEEDDVESQKQALLQFCLNDLPTNRLLGPSIHHCDATETKLVNCLECATTRDVGGTTS